MMIGIRAFLIGLVRLILVVALIIFSQKFEVSPLPEWTLGVFIYVCLFAVTYGLARWVFTRRTPDLKSIIITFILFVVIETGFEISFYLFSVRYASWYDVMANLGVHTLLLYGMYFIAVWFAGMMVRRKRVEEQLPEGLTE